VFNVSSLETPEEAFGSTTYGAVRDMDDGGRVIDPGTEI
jgi:hypothetical protein